MLNITPRVGLAIGVSIIFGATICLLFFANVPTSSREALLVLLGALANEHKEIISYYFGSSETKTNA